MKKNSLFIIYFISLISCNTLDDTQNLKSIKILDFPIENTSIRAILSISKDTMYFAGANGYIGFTNDAGKNWSIRQITYQDSIIPDFRSIAKTNKTIYVLSIGNPALLFNITNNQSNLVYKEENPKVFYDSLLFIDNQNGIAIGDPTDDCMSIITTNNAGETWEKISCDSIPKIQEGEAAFAASNTNIASINKTIWVASGGKYSRVYKSTNIGKTWQVFETPIVQGKETQGIYSIAFYDELQGIILGGDYSNPSNNYKNKAITTDGGQTWDLIANGKEPNYKSCVQYVPNSQGKEIFSVGKTGISYSNDAGKYWKKISIKPYYTIQFIDNKTAWLGGSKGIAKMIIP